MTSQIGLKTACCRATTSHKLHCHFFRAIEQFAVQFSEIYSERLARHLGAFEEARPGDLAISEQ
jgi:hypothetical protein